MNLGETIYRLRTEKELSQGDLAEMLNVSRQSISKWENNSSVPDLEKLIKLSDIFGVSLDELVKGQEAPCRNEVVNTAHQEKANETGFPPRKIAGTILFCMAFFSVMFFLVAGAGLGGFILALPFITCGILCFALKKNVGFWCAWDLYVLFDIYMYYATGISKSMVLLTFQWTQQMNYVRLVFAWIFLISWAVMIAITVVRFGKEPFTSEQTGHKRLIMYEMRGFFYLITFVVSWVKTVALTVALVFTSRFIKMIKKK